MQHLEVSCAVRRFFKSLGFKGLTEILKRVCIFVMLPLVKLREKKSFRVVTCLQMELIAPLWLRACQKMYDYL